MAIIPKAILGLMVDHLSNSRPLMTLPTSTWMVKPHTKAPLQGPTKVVTSSTEEVRNGWITKMGTKSLTTWIVATRTSSSSTTSNSIRRHPRRIRRDRAACSTARWRVTSITTIDSRGSNTLLATRAGTRRAAMGCMETSHSTRAPGTNRAATMMDSNRTTTEEALRVTPTNTTGMGNNRGGKASETIVVVAR